MSAAELGDIFLNSLIGEQVESSVLQENDNNLVKYHFDDNDSHFSSQTIVSANDHNIYVFPKTVPADDSVNPPVRSSPVRHHTVRPLSVLNQFGVLPFT